MMVKICGITNRDDAMAAVEAGASAIGFNFYRESPRYIAPSGAALIAEKIPANVWKVGIFVSEGAESVAKIVLNVGLDVAQLYGRSEARGIRVWRACRANEDISSSLKNDALEALLLDAPAGSPDLIKCSPTRKAWYPAARRRWRSLAEWMPLSVTLTTP